MIIEIQWIENYLQFIKKMRSIYIYNNKRVDCLFVYYSCTMLHKSQNIIF